MNYEKPLRRALGLGSAKEGVKHWMSQRMTAVALVPLGLWFVAYFISFITVPFETSFHAFTSPWLTTLAILFIFTSFYHGYLGLQVVLEDYVHHEFTRWFLILCAKFLSIIFTLLAILSILKIYLS